MTTVDAPNVHALAVKGSFDDCQDLVKRLFNDPAQRAAHQLTAVNSINWARIMAQVVYYFYAGLKAGALDQPVNFVVPTGNFGNVYAGYVAKRLGLPVNKLVIATNSNDSLIHFINDGVMQPGLVSPTLSPSMDIQIASNAERYLFELLGRDGEAVNKAMQGLKTEKKVQIPSQVKSAISADFMAFSVDDAGTEATMKALWDEKRLLVDPHTAVGLHIARQLKDTLEGPVIALACAHPAKFPETVQRVTGQQAPLPPALADLYQRRERMKVMDNDYSALVNALNETRNA
jgi:threonine synthase